MTLAEKIRNLVIGASVSVTLLFSSTNAVSDDKKPKREYFNFPNGDRAIWMQSEFFPEESSVQRLLKSGEYTESYISTRPRLVPTRGGLSCYLSIKTLIDENGDNKLDSMTEIFFIAGQSPFTYKRTREDYEKLASSIDKEHLELFDCMIKLGKEGLQSSFQMKETEEVLKKLLKKYELEDAY